MSAAHRGSESWRRFCPDHPSEHLASTSTFKEITGGDKLVGERKFCDSFEVSIVARLVFSANHLPRSSDSSHGFFRRWLAFRVRTLFVVVVVLALRLAWTGRSLRWIMQRHAMLDRAILKTWPSLPGT
jgi:uncharacterized protein DUF5906